MKVLVLCGALVALAAVPASAIGQQPVPVGAQRGPAYAAGVAAGRAAGGGPGVGGRAAVAALGGVFFGFSAPLASKTPALLIPAGAGLSAVVLAARNGAAEPPDALLRALPDTTTAYRDGFRDGYSNRLRQRRTRAALIGGTAGTVGGLALLVVTAIAVLTNLN